MQIRIFAHTKILNTCLAVSILAGVTLVPAQNVFAQNINSQGNAQSKVAAMLGQPVLQRRKRGIDAELVDQGDFYLHPDGSEIRLRRKKDVFVIESDNSARSMQRINAQFGERVEEVGSHQLNGRRVVRVDNSDQAKQRHNETFDVSAAMLENADNSIRALHPVFSNSKGEGDILLMPKLTIKLESGVNLTDALNRLDSRYGLTMDRKVRVSGNVFSLSLKNTLSESQQFALVRRVMNDVMVEWAEPSFVSKPFKTSYTPNDTFITEQWHIKNTGSQGSRCDTDCDANNAWGINVAGNTTSGGNASGANSDVAGDGMVIAIIDDGVQLNHPDLATNIWVHPNETENDAEGFIGDINGWDFVDETNNGLLDSNGIGPCPNPNDGTLGPDNDPSPQVTSNCTTVNSDPVENDNHGTSVAGLAAAVGDNNLGVAGTAFRAEILPIRLISEFDGGVDFCNRAAEAMAYAGRYADVISNSWGVDLPSCNALEDTIADVVSGTNNGSGATVFKRPGLGSPVIFSSGNSASGWVKVTIPVTAGEHAYEWRFLRDNLFPSSEDGDRAWLDDITWPDNTVEDFEGAGSLVARGFDVDNVSAGNTCIAGCVDPVLGDFFVDGAAWSIATNPEPLFSGTKAALINSASPADCSNTYLHIIRDEGTAGNISFWVWVDTNTQEDKFEFLIDGNEVLSMGDFPQFVQNGSLTQQAELSATIAVGASNSGDLTGLNGAGLSFERRAYYSQYGPMLDVLAPSSDQSLAIVTTDRSGNSDGYNDGFESTGNYTNTFGGTSASAPIVAGIAASILAVDVSLSASNVRDILRRTTDKIGDTNLYSSDGSGDTRSDFYGYGRVNMYKAILDADPQLAVSSAPAENSCTAEPFSFVSGSTLFQPIDLNGFMCPAVGEIPQDDELCFPIVAANGNIAVVCL